MKDIEKFGAEILLAQIAAGGVVYFGTSPLGADILALVTAVIVAMAFSAVAMWRAERANAAVGYASASAALVTISLLNPQAALAGILLVIFAFAYFAAVAFAVVFVKRGEETFGQIFFSALWPMGALKYLKASLWRFWGRWIHRGAR